MAPRLRSPQPAALRLVDPTLLVGHPERPVLAADADDPGVVPDAQVEGVGEIGQVPDHVVGVGEVAAGVAGEAQAGIVGQQRIPVHAQVELGVVPAGVRLVDRDEPPVPRESVEERPRRRTGLDDQIVPSSPLQEVAELQPCRTRADHEIVHGSPSNCGTSGVRRRLSGQLGRGDLLQPPPTGLDAVAGDRQGGQRGRMAPSAAAPVRLGGASPITTTLTPAAHRRGRRLPPDRFPGPDACRIHLRAVRRQHREDGVRAHQQEHDERLEHVWVVSTRGPSATKAKRVAEVSRTTPIIVRLLLQKP